MYIYSDAFNALQDFYMLWLELYTEYSFEFDNETAALLADLEVSQLFNEED